MTLITCFYPFRYLVSTKHKTIIFYYIIFIYSYMGNYAYVSAFHEVITPSIRRCSYSTTCYSFFKYFAYILSTAIGNFSNRVSNSISRWHRFDEIVISGFSIFFPNSKQAKHKSSKPFPCTAK